LYFLDLLNIGILVVSADPKITFCNNWLEKRLTNPELAKKGTSLSSLFNLTEYGRLVESIDSASAQSRSSVLSDKLNKLPFKLKTGNTELSYNLYISPLTEKESKTKSVLIQFLDITKVKEKELYLKRKQDEIDQQRQISFSQERLASLGELTSSIAHEINNPLSILNAGNTILKKLLKKDTLNKEMAFEIIDDNEATIQRITDLIGGIRNLSRKPSDEDFEMMNLRVVIEDIIPVFKNLFGANEIDFKIDLESELFNREIPLLRVLISQVFINLLNNSIHEIKTQDSPWIELDGSIDEKFLHLNFTDSGSGIPKEIREKIFLPFFTTKDIGKGTGLGLSTIQKIVASHGGDIRIDAGCENTRFVIDFPLEQINCSE
jgi:signal transduction histidine kinase